MDTVFRLAYYRKEDWSKHVTSADDPEKLHDCWEDWLKSFIETKMMLELQGKVVEVITIDIDGLLKYAGTMG